ncbi:pectinesterase family protein [Actinoplanes sp. CA-015351]|uniref:pectinesterase family protein n=1 Tax=Actinoplanes sp. CA-015351 TaxID=3239897 RepID=UPI003D95C7F1
MVTALTLLLTGTSAAAAADSTPPNSVRSLKASVDTKRVKLDWSSNSEKDLAGYLVYRAPAADGDFVKLTSTPFSSSEYSDYAAPAGVTAYYRITAVDSSGNESAAVSVSATRKDAVAPSAPKSLTAVGSLDDVTLDWADNDEADLAGYRVYRGSTLLNSTVINDSRFVDAAAPAGTASTYKIVAVDLSGNISASASIAAKRLDATAPATPKSLKATVSSSKIKLDWSTNSEKDLAGYLVYRASSANGEYARLTATPVDDSDYTDGTAPTGVSSFYRVTAIDASGNESAAASVSATRPDIIAPVAPASLTAVASAGQVTLDWADGTEPDLAGYRVYRGSTLLTGSLISASQFVDTSAATGVVSTYKVVAVDLSGNASSAASISATLPDLAAPAAVKGLKVSADTSKIKIDWSSNSEDDLAGYRVYRATSTDGTYTLLTAKPRSSSDYSDSTAPAGLPVYYRITAVDSSGNESAAVSVTAIRLDKVAPAAAARLTATGTAAGVTLDWADSAEADLAGYRVYRGSTLLTGSLISTSEFVDTAAPVGVATTYKIVVVDLSGNASVAATIIATRVDVTPPVTPEGFSATAADTRVVLIWSANTESDLAGYRVYRDGTLLKTVTGATYTDTAVTNGTTYQYAVTAIDKAGNESPVTGTIAAVPADVTAPAAPAGLVAAGSATGITLDWADSTEADLAGYLVYRASESDGQYTRLTPAAIAGSAYGDLAAPADTVSYYRVTTVDRAGNESPVSGTAFAAPLDVTAPAAPAALTGVGTDTDTGVTLDWADSTEADLAGYLVLRDGVPLTTTPITVSQFADTTGTPGVVYAYTVTAVDTTGNASTAATASAARSVVYNPVADADLTVAQDGTGDYTTVAAALAAAPASSTAPFVIAVKAGTYRETVTVDKPYVTLVGATGTASDVVISYNNAAGTAKPDGSGTYGTSGSATALIKSNNVLVKNLTIENAYAETGSGSEQAVALKTTGDRLVFDNVRLLGDQDTLYADSAKVGAVARSYFVNSYIEGDVDFIFGRGTAVFDRSTLKAATRGSTSNNGYITAASTDKSLTYGYLITDSTVESDAPNGTFHLGRPWQPSGDTNAIAQVVIRDSVLPAAVKSAPWTDMTTTFSWRDARFAEYNNTGAGATVSSDRPQLTAVQAAQYTKWNYLAGSDNWNPTGQAAPPPPADVTAPAVPAGLTASAGDTSVALTWTASTESDLAGYQIYRNGVALTTAAITGAGYTDRTAANGTTYSYSISAVDTSGNESVRSSTVEATPVGVVLPRYDFLVAADGSGTHTTVSAAIAAATAGTAAKPTVIVVKAGVYREIVSLTKNYVQIIGATGKATDVTITYDNASKTINPATGAAYGTSGSSTMLIKGNNVTVKNVTIENAYAETGVGSEQAVALQTTGDRLTFDGVRLLGNQDTLLVNSGDADLVARSYFVNSYIEGDVDFIFGRGTAVFEKCTINALTRGSSSNNGYLTAASTSDKNPYGFLITDSTITSNAPAGTVYLGRPWRGWTDGYTKNGVVYNSRGQVTIRNTALPAAIKTATTGSAPGPWTDMSPNLWTDGRFSEYGNTGPGATVTERRPQLTDEQATSYTVEKYLAGTDGWNPTGR